MFKRALLPDFINSGTVKSLLDGVHYINIPVNTPTGEFLNALQYSHVPCPACRRQTVVRTPYSTPKFLKVRVLDSCDKCGTRLLFCLHRKCKPCDFKLECLAVQLASFEMALIKV